MILLKTILIGGFVLLLIRFVLSPNSYQIRAWKKIIGALFVALAILAILLPNQLNRVAHFFGVGRGADLLLYLLSLAFIFALINQYLNEKQEQKRFVRLARKVALLEAEQHNKRHKKT